MPRQRRIEYGGAIHCVLSRGNRREAIFLDDAAPYDFLKTLAEAIRRGEMKRRGWKKAERRPRPKTDSDKVGIAARLREETALTIGQIAQRLKMGTRDTWSAKLQERKGAND